MKNIAIILFLGLATSSCALRGHHHYGHKKKSCSYKNKKSYKCWKKCKEECREKCESKKKE